MQQVRINAELFESLDNRSAKQVADIMRESGLVDGEVEIVGDGSVPAPEMGEQVYGLSFSEVALDALNGDEMGPEFRIRLPRIRIPGGICRMGCDAAAAAASAKAAALTGPALAAAMAAIKVARDACRSRC